jgi:DnaJ-class molecular chaperone
MTKSYFAILGISSTASSEEIKSAYRELAKVYHPDHYEGDSQRFREIQEAYSVLGDTQKRRSYQRSLDSYRPVRPSRHTPYSGPEPLGPENRPVNERRFSFSRAFGPSFDDDVFAWLRESFFEVRPRSGRMRDLMYEVPLTREQARRGGTITVMVPLRTVCPACRGTGDVGYYGCAHCAGDGYLAEKLPVRIALDPGVKSDFAVGVSLDAFGIRDRHLTLLFRLTDTHG